MGEDQLNGGNGERETGLGVEEDGIQVIVCCGKGAIFFILCQAFKQLTGQGENSLKINNNLSLLPFPISSS